MRIRISSPALPDGFIDGVLEDSPTVRGIAAILPSTSEANTWGEEVYFEIPVSAQLDPNPKQVVPQGAICFWVQGSSMAIPYGPTPVSEGKECRLVTAVNVLGKIEGDPKRLAAIQPGDPITVSSVAE